MMPCEHYRYPNRQSKPPFYRFGNLYVMRRKTLLGKRSLFGERCLALRVDLASCFDVNDVTDLKLAGCMVTTGIVSPGGWMDRLPKVQP
jgi:CMP-N-acetylneuraminic acid synthetase